MPSAISKPSSAPKFVPPVQDRAALRTIKFTSLLDQDQDAISALVAASKEVGFFYLDLTDAASQELMENLGDLKDTMADWFTLPEPVKRKAPTITKAHGYKPIGTHAGVGGQRDGWEALKIGRPEIQARWALADVVKKNLTQFDDFMDGSHFVLKIILSCLSCGMGLRGNNSLQAHHRDDRPSKSSVFFLHYPPRDTTVENMGQNMHTDLGTLTLLFTTQWGLQVLCPANSSDPSAAAAAAAGGSEHMEWKFVEPKPGHAIINVGDTLRFLTNKQLRSALHRVIPLYEGDRYSVTYFLRPSDDAEFVDSEGESIDAMKWYLKKNSTYESTYEKQRKDSVLLGGIEQHGSINATIKA